MFIKHIIIKNFKSYRQLAYIEPLHPSVNVILGGNGQGKSNVIDAIIFVLTDKYSNLRQEDKKMLVHEEQGEEITEVVVELVIDNKSRRLPIDKDTVNISKIYYPKENKEDLIINQKKLLKSEVYNILESAGFNKHNPYYIIQQGKVNSLINMTEIELYELFAEVSGTKLYEQKRADSFKLLEESKETKKKIIKQGEDISKHIQKLEQQCSELKNFEKYERERKALEYFSNSERISEIQVSLDILEENKNKTVSTLEVIYSTEQKIKEKMGRIFSFFDIQKKKKAILQTRLETTEEEINKIKNQNLFEKNNLKQIKANDKKIKADKTKIQERKTEIMRLKETFDKDCSKLTSKINDIIKELIKYNKQFTDLSEKSEIMMMSGSGANSTNLDKSFFKNELEKFKNAKESINTKISTLYNELNKDEKATKDLQNKFEEETSNLKTLQESKSSMLQELLNLKKSRFEATCEIKGLGNDIGNLQKEIDFLLESNREIEKNLPGVDTLKAIRKIKAKNFPGFYGMLIDLLDIKEINPKIRCAIDICAKDKLYTLVVNNLDTAQIIMNYNLSNGGPVISIFPLEWASDSEKKIIYPNSNQVFPLIKYLKLKEEFLRSNDIFSEKTLQAMLNKFFGKFLLVQNYDIGVKFAKEYDLSCITSENEMVNAGGFISRIGYYNTKKERLSLYDELNDNLEKTKQYNDEIISFDDKKLDLMNKETIILRDIQPNIIKTEGLEKRITQTEKLIQNFDQERVSLTELTKIKKENVENLIKEKELLEKKIENYSKFQNNTGGNKQKKLTIEQENELNSILKEKDQVQKLILELESVKTSSLSQKNEKLEKLKNLCKEEEQLNLTFQNKLVEDKENHAEVLELNVSDDKNDEMVKFYMDKNSDLVIKYENFKQQYIQKIKSIDKEVETASLELTQTKSELEQVSTKRNLEENKIKSLSLELKDFYDKKQNLLKKIGSIGQIQAEVIEQLNIKKNNILEKLNHDSSLSKENFLNMLLEPFILKLNKTDKNMKDFEKINRFALEDYMKFKEKESELDEKILELNLKLDSILEVIELLDEKKENAINTTFQKINKHFSESFLELVPNGAATLSIEDVPVTQKSQDQRLSNTNNNSVNGKMIGIRVSFGGNRSSLLTMHQLSGGQKTAVGIILIFALSKIDPAPFYILDEIDAALDPVLRSNLAKMITKLSRENQFIITTFKQELLDISNKAYQVKFVNKSSNLHEITKESAKSILSELTMMENKKIKN